MADLDPTFNGAKLHPADQEILLLRNRVAELEANHRLGVALMEKAKTHIAELETALAEANEVIESAGRGMC